MKLTRAQKARLKLIAAGCQRAEDGVCSRHDAGYPAWPMEARLRDAGMIEIVSSRYGRWPMHSCDGYRLTEAGRKFLAEVAVSP